MALLYSKKLHEINWRGADGFTNISYTAKYYDFMPGDYVIMRHELESAPDVLVCNIVGA